MVTSARVITELQQRAAAETPNFGELVEQIELILRDPDANWQVLYNAASFWARLAQASEGSLAAADAKRISLALLGRALGDVSDGEALAELVEWLRHDRDLAPLGTPEQLLLLPAEPANRTERGLWARFRDWLRR